MTELVHYDVADGVGTITLDTPHNRNALSRQLVTELFERLDRAAEDDDGGRGRARSADRVFCSGADLSEAAERRHGGGRAARMVELQRRIVTHPKPVVTRLARAGAGRRHRHRRPPATS